MRLGGTKVKVEEGCLEVRATEMAEATSAIVVTRSPPTAISVLARSVNFQRGIRCDGVDGRYDRKMIRSLSVSWVMSRPSVGYPPLGVYFNINGGTKRFQRKFEFYRCLYSGSMYNCVVVIVGDNVWLS